MAKSHYLPNSLYEKEKRPKKEQKQRAAGEEFSHECMNFSIMSSDEKYKPLATFHHT